MRTILDFLKLTDSVKALLVIIFFTAYRSPAQEPQKYPFIEYDLNHFYFSKDSSSFMKFYQRLDSFGQKKIKQISIAHIGGSHVQGGTWSNTFVGNLQAEFKPSGGGYFVFPYKIAKTNSPPYATSFTNGNWRKCRCVGKEFCLPLGMCGMSIITNDSSMYFGVSLTKRALIKGFNSIKVYHNFNPSFEFNISDKHKLQAVRIDRKDLGYTQFDIEMPTDSLMFDLVKKDSLQRDFIIYGFGLESNLANGFYLAALGANGAASNSFLRCTHFVDQLRTIKPDLVIFSLGVNDTQAKNFAKDDYIEYYDSLIMKVKEANPAVAILLTTTTDNYIRRRTSNKRPIQAKEAMFELMNKHNVAVWDLYSLMGGYKSIVKWGKAGLAAKDRVHFSPKGYTIIGNLMAEALLKSYHNNFKK
jgi:lysophospholipase L1-like esterase